MSERKSAGKSATRTSMNSSGNIKSKSGVRKSKISIRSTTKSRSSRSLVAKKKNGPKKSAIRDRIRSFPIQKTKQEVNGAVHSGINGFSAGADPQVVQPAASVRRSKKGSRKLKMRSPLPPPVEVSSHPKTKVKNMLVSQPKPLESDKNPYFSIAKKYHVNIQFRQFIKVVGLNAVEFRAQRVDILEHGAVILTSKMAVDHFFRICNDMRITVPETMKYFCINEQTAYYLQKYIQYRKRKIFFGHGTLLDLVDVIKKNRGEKFLLPANDAQKEQIIDFLEDLNITFTKATFYKTVPADLSDLKSLAEYDLLVFFTPVGIHSLKQNFPGFKQGNTRIAAFGRTTALTVKSLGYRLDIFAPSAQNPSMSSALEHYIKDASRR